MAHALYKEGFNGLPCMMSLCIDGVALAPVTCVSVTTASNRIQQDATVKLGWPLSCTVVSFKIHVLVFMSTLISY